MIRVLEYDRLDSTNLEARRLWEAGEWQSAPYAVVAGEQTGGMGRDGRRWESPPGGLWMTVAWPLRAFDTAGRGLALVAGLATRDAIANVTGIEAAIKWPNDLLVDGRKVCGILCQADSALSPPVVFVGIGINVNLRVRELGEGLRTPAAALQELLARPVSMAGLRDALLGELSGRLTAFDRGGFAVMSREIAGRLEWRGRQVIVRNPGNAGDRSGVLAGIDEEGRLLLETQAGMVALMSGEMRAQDGD